MGEGKEEEDHTLVMLESSCLLLEVKRFRGKIGGVGSKLRVGGGGGILRSCPLPHPLHVIVITYITMPTLRAKNVGGGMAP